MTTPAPAKLNFSLNIDNDSDDDLNEPMNGDKRLESMLAVQAAFHQETPDSGGEDDILNDPSMSRLEKQAALQRLLNMAASNGDTHRVRRILQPGMKEYMDVDAVDEEGSSPLIYAACFVSMAPRTSPRISII